MPRESTAPPPPDDRPYDDKLMRLAEILGAMHYLRELCGAEEGQIWREQMKDILRNEGTTAVRRAKLVNAFNDGYRGYRRTYRTCTQSATLATTRFSAEGATIAAALAQSSTFASKGPPEAKPEAPRRAARTRRRPHGDQTGAAPPDGADQTQAQSPGGGATSACAIRLRRGPPAPRADPGLTLKIYLSSLYRPCRVVGACNVASHPSASHKGAPELRSVKANAAILGKRRREAGGAAIHSRCLGRGAA